MAKDQSKSDSTDAADSQAEKMADLTHRLHGQGLSMYEAMRIARDTYPQR